LQNQYSGTSFSIVTLTPKGTQLLAGRPARLCLLLPAHLEAEDARQRQREQKEAAERQRREAVQQAKNEEAAEKELLLAELKRARKATADALGQVRNVIFCLCFVAHTLRACCKHSAFVLTQEVGVSASCCIATSERSCRAAAA
jgi:hypothetical protein